MLLLMTNIVFTQTNLIKEKYNNYIEKASNETEIPELLISAIITVESRWNEKATDGLGSNGLMQIQKGTFDPEKNILDGTKIFKYYLTKSNNDTLKALTAYNRGFTGMKRYYKKHGHCSNYAKRVMKIYKYYQKVFYEGH